MTTRKPITRRDLHRDPDGWLAIVIGVLIPWIVALAGFVYEYLLRQ